MLSATKYLNNYDKEGFCCCLSSEEYLGNWPVARKWRTTGSLHRNEMRCGWYQQMTPKSDARAGLNRSKKFLRR
ncbi:hypothetical protein F511_43539 [Dorcoceras hygrometricum]|uniref:Uncharacterized protein n=1 Tax=Dorcoceras hygrometricum TaxID=472368 RepID=A0A2Z7DDD6_9LAMI|nr:hypothetical protein F511_43539 [Dorcoceras hygrometricum]